MTNREIYEEFQQKWSLERIEKMTLDEYTSVGGSSRDDFCYWLERKMNTMGSVLDGSAFKFGIYRSARDEKAREEKGLKYDGGYAWLTKYGDTKEQAFETIRSEIIQIIKASQLNDLKTIDSIDFSTRDFGVRIKWKIAFHYQHIDDFAMINIFQESMLKEIAAREFGDESLTIPQIYTRILNNRQWNFNDIQDKTEALWEAYNTSSNFCLSQTYFNNKDILQGEKTIPLNQILYGPPGTGKTYSAIDRVLEILCEYGEIDSIPQERDEKKKKFDEFMEQGQIDFVAFHQSYGYEDFVEGIKPKLDNNDREKVGYEITNGVFKQMCKKASKNYEKSLESTLDNRLKPYILIIDEINRGNISKILGELITLLEPSKRKGNNEYLEAILPYSKESFSVPKNLYIIGTMNTADRSIALLDTALRRRFEFIEMLPDSSKLSADCDGVDLQKLLETINARIEFLLGRERSIGHAFFIDVKNLNDLQTAFKHKILPLLQEYFYDDYAKINAVLNNNEMIKSQTQQDLGIKLDDEFVDSQKKVWSITDSSSWAQWQFQKIYDTNAKPAESKESPESSNEPSE